MKFFMYATMMSTPVLRKTAPSARAFGTAILNGWRTDFLRPSKAGGGAMGIIPDASRRVHGVMFEVDEVDLEALDALELGAMYHRITMTVQTPDGPLNCSSYQPVPEAGFPFAPRPDYLAKMQAGSDEHGLPAECMQTIRASAARAEGHEHVFETPPAEPVTKAADVTADGGGLSGVVAAIASARQGARTLLVERAGFLGGDGINCGTGLHSFFNVYQHEPATERVQVVGGIPREIAENLVEARGSLGDVEMEIGGKYLSVLTPVDQEVFKDVALKMCRDAGVDLLLHTWVTDALVERDPSGGATVVGVKAVSKSGREALKARVVVDCSGDADVAASAGAPFTHRKGPENWGMSLTFRLGGVDLDAAAEQIGAHDQVFQLAHAKRFGDDEPHVCRLAVDMNKHWADAVARWGIRGRFLATSIHAGEATQMNCTMYGPVDSLDRDDLTAAELGLRDQIGAVVGYLRENIEGFSSCHVTASSASGGVRRSRVVHTRYELTPEDLISGRQFEDAIGLFGLIDDKKTFIEGNGAYGIPYRSLLPVGVEGLLVAGRSIGQDDLVHTSTRMMANCMVQGQGAGTAAAVAALADQPPSEVDPMTLTEALAFDGAILDL